VIFSLCLVAQGSAKQAAKIAHADGGGNAAVVRGGVALIHTILFGKLNAT